MTPTPDNKLHIGIFCALVLIGGVAAWIYDMRPAKNCLGAEINGERILEDEAARLETLNAFGSLLPIAGSCGWAALNSPFNDVIRRIKRGD